MTNVSIFETYFFIDINCNILPCCQPVILNHWKNTTDTREILACDQFYLGKWEEDGSLGYVKEQESHSLMLNRDHILNDNATREHLFNDNVTKNKTGSYKIDL